MAIKMLNSFPRCPGKVYVCVCVQIITQKQLRKRKFELIAIIDGTVLMRFSESCFACWRPSVVGCLQNAVQSSTTRPINRVQITDSVPRV